MCCGVINWSKLKRTLFVKKNYAARGFSTCIIQSKLRAQILIVINWSKLAFFCDAKLGPVNNPYLDS